jgi:signal-transduction protein with cAMP-binding, CBS, and nucleotidyltransferase domain
MQLNRIKRIMQVEKTTCLPCLNTEAVLQTLALDLLHLTARLKLARCVRAHKNTFNKQNNTPSMKA